MRIDWKFKRIKEICNYISRGVTPNYVDKGIYKVVNQATFSKGYWDIENIKYSTNNRKEALIKKGDLLIASTGGGVLGKVYYVEDDIHDYYADSHVTIIRSSNNISNTKFLYYIFSINYLMINTLLAKGSTNQTELQRNKLLDLILNIPPLQEQISIINYLDAKTTQISTQISLLAKKRDTYLRLKKSLIHKVVTKGLNPNVELKDSEIDWLGKIPKHWEMKRAKTLFTEAKLVSLTGMEDLLSVSEYYGIARRLDKMDENEEYESRSNSLIGYKICKKGDLVINIMLAWKRGLGVSNYDGIVSPAYAVYKSKGIHSMFFHYLMRTDMYVAEFKRNSKGIIDSRLRLYTERFYNILFPTPPLSEQMEIADYLNKQSEKIDTIISNINAQIQKLQTLRKSLINEIVTGERSII